MAQRRKRPRSWAALSLVSAAVVIAPAWAALPISKQVLVPAVSGRRWTVALRGGAVPPSPTGGGGGGGSSSSFPPPQQSNPPPLRKKTPLRTLKQLLQELEESDYGSSFGSWGNFDDNDGASDNEGKAGQQPLSAQQQPLHSQQQQQQQRRSLDPATTLKQVREPADGRWSDPTMAEKDLAAAQTGQLPPLASATAAAVTAASARPIGRRRGGSPSSQSPRAALAADDADVGAATFAAAVAALDAPLPPVSAWQPPAQPSAQLLAQPSPQAATQQRQVGGRGVAPDEAEDLTLREPRDVDATVAVAEALRTVYRCLGLGGLGMALAYAAVVPASPAAPGAALAGPAAAAAARLAFNRKFHQNLALLAATLAPSALFSSVVFDGTKMTVHDFVKVLFMGATWGYALAFGLEVAVATALRLGVYRLLEPEVVRVLVMDRGLPPHALPWLGGLRDAGLRLKPLTSFVADFLVDCVGCPLVEEYAKYAVLQRSMVLPPSGSELASHTSVHAYLAYGLAAAAGLKLADNARRVSLYARPEHFQKTFFAFARGVFPVHELCGALTAMQLAKRDVLGKPCPAWRVILPAALLHGMGNFRGKKPLFKWGSASPWVEMQLQAWSTADDAPPSMVIANGLTGLLWLSALAKVAVHLCRRYYSLAREQRQMLRLRRYTAWQGRPEYLGVAPAAAPEPPLPLTKVETVTEPPPHAAGHAASMAAGTSLPASGK